MKWFINKTFSVPIPKKTLVFQSKVLVDQHAQFAIDGSKHTCSLATGAKENEHAWWTMELRRSFTFYKIVIFFKAYQETGHLMFYW